jgi:6-phosphogluconolactonase
MRAESIRTVEQIGAGPISVTVDPSGKFVYVANLASDNVSVFAIDSNTGVLTLVAQPVAAGSSPSGVVTTGRVQ